MTSNSEICQNCVFFKQNDWVFHENNIIDMHDIALQLTEHTEES